MAMQQFWVKALTQRNLRSPPAGRSPSHLMAISIFVIKYFMGGHYPPNLLSAFYRLPSFAALDLAFTLLALRLRAESLASYLDRWRLLGVLSIRVFKALPKLL